MNDKRHSQVDVVSIEKSSNCKEYENGVPVLEEYRLPTGAVVELVPKDVHHETMMCPVCQVPLRYDEYADAVCNECGIVNPPNSAQRVSI